MCVVDNTKEVCFHLNGIPDVHVVAVVDCCLGNGDCLASLGDDLCSHSLCGSHQFFFCDNLIYKADAVCFVGIDIVTGKDHFFGTSHTNKTGKSLGTAESRDNTKTALRLSENSIVGCDTDITRHSNLTSAAESKTVDSSDGNLTHIH